MNVDVCGAREVAFVAAEELPGRAADPAYPDNRAMRLTDFWQRMEVAFGPHADSLAEYHVLSQLGGRTIRQALAEGESPKDIWRGVCEGLELPAHQR